MWSEKCMEADTSPDIKKKTDGQDTIYMWQRWLRAEVHDQFLYFLWVESYKEIPIV